MNESKTVDNLEFIKIIEELSSFGISNRNLYLLLYSLTCQKEGFRLDFVTEKNSVNNDNSLLQKEGNKLNLYYEKRRLELKNVPEEKKVFLKLNEVFSKLFSDLKSSLDLKDFMLLEGISQNQLESNNDFGKIFDTFLEVIVGFQGKRMGEFVLPSEIGEFLINLGELEPNASVFNPFAGLATFGAHLENQQTYLGHEINELIWAVSVLRLNAHDRLNYSEFLNVDSFGNWPSSRKFDLVIANPPFRLRLSINQQNDFSGEKWVEGFFLHEGIKLLKPKGKLITIVPRGFLSSHGDKKIRQHLVEQDLLEAVISFPGGLLMQTNIPFVVLIINNNKTHKNEIAFIQGSEYITDINKNNKLFYAEGLLQEVKSALLPNNNQLNEPSSLYNQEAPLLPEFIGIENIVENDYYLEINRYRIKNLKGTELKKLLHFEETFSYEQALEYLEKEDVVDYNFRAPYREFKYVSTKDLKTDSKDYFIDIDSLSNKRVRHGKFINKDVFLVSMIGGNLKPSFLTSGNAIIHLSNEVLPFTINKNLIYPQWLVRELGSAKVKEQLKVLLTGVIPRIRKEDFLNLKIEVPSIKQQHLEMEEIQGLEKQVDDLESNIIEQNSYLRHTVAGPLSDLEHAIEAIDIIIRNLSENKMPQILKTKVSNNHLYTLGEHLEDSRKYVTFIVDTIANKLNTSQSIAQKKLEKLNLLSCIEKYVKRKNENANSLGYYIDFSFDKDFFNDHLNENFDTILGNKELVIVLLDNMVENACKHAFSKDKDNKIEIYVWGYDEDIANKRICFTIANTGNPVPKGTTLNDLKKRGFSKSDKSGDGFGLYLVNEIVRKHKGDWFLVNDLWLEGITETRYLTNSRINYAIPKSDLITKFSFNFPILEE